MGGQEMTKTLFYHIIIYYAHNAEFPAACRSFLVILQNRHDRSKIESANLNEVILLLIFRQLANITQDLPRAVLPLLMIFLMSTAAPAAAKAVTEPVTSATPAASVTDVTEVHPVSSFLEDERPAISARSVQYDEKSGRYICHGTVKITLGNRLITADEAQITSDLSTIWTQGSARLIDGENIFCSEAIYARPLEGQAFFFGTRCKLKRPGLAIDSDSIEYRWQDKIGVFDGHVLYIDSDGEKAFVHVEYDFNKNKIA